MSRDLRDFVAVTAQIDVPEPTEAIDVLVDVMFFVAGKAGSTLICSVLETRPDLYEIGREDFSYWTVMFGQVQQVYMTVRTYSRITDGVFLLVCLVAVWTRRHLRQIGSRDGRN
jgi:hypothetical protein